MHYLFHNYSFLDFWQMKHKNMLENKTISKKWQKSFQENLIQRLGPEEGRALDVLGNDFFYLVDNLF